MSSSLAPLKEPPCRGVDEGMLRLKRPPIGVEGYQLRCHPLHLTMAQNDEVRRPKNPRVAEMRDVNI
ncbi:hypothetical protein TNCV_1834481 [Trichonephila clavipes]|nr:hypothetical protein TNCV_1834481 [Trichonephila clavipes]